MGQWCPSVLWHMVHLNNYMIWYRVSLESTASYSLSGHCILSPFPIIINYRPYILSHLYLPLLIFLFDTELSTHAPPKLYIIAAPSSSFSVICCQQSPCSSLPSFTSALLTTYNYCTVLVLHELWPLLASSFGLLRLTLASSHSTMRLPRC